MLGDFSCRSTHVKVAPTNQQTQSTANNEDGECDDERAAESKQYDLRGCKDYNNHN